jgi:predicted MPP superfamily phosphohydrolase
LLHLDARGKRVLFISDTHIPYSVDGYLTFLKELKDKFKPEIVIHGGDELDYHCISFHKSISELFSAGHELDRSIIEIQEGLHKLFPKLYLLESNHGSLIFRRLKHEGIPIRHLKPLNELYETPLWEWHNKIVLQTNKGKVAVAHGMSGIALQWAKACGMSTVEFHYHSKHHITKMRSLSKDIFSMHCGCLADQEKMAFEYAKSNLAEFINGTGGLYADGEPVLFTYSKKKHERNNATQLH